MDRHLDWAGCLNARDLGGFRTADNKVTCWGAVVRSDNPAFLRREGWAALHGYGIRTIVALRTNGTTDDERDVPADVVIDRVPIEDLNDPGFIERCVDPGLWCTPIYFREMLEHWPERCVAAISAVAHSRPGGVVISCGRGCDRTGLVAFLLLGLLGVGAGDIAADWLMSVERLRPRDPSYEASLQAILESENATVAESIAQTLRSIDIEERLLSAGLAADEVLAIKARLLADGKRQCDPELS